MINEEKRKVTLIERATDKRDIAIVWMEDGRRMIQLPGCLPFFYRFIDNGPFFIQGDHYMPQGIEIYT